MLFRSSNPATIMTDSNMADKVYLEPLNIDVIQNIMIQEKVDSLLATLGGQTGLNFAMELSESGFLEKNDIVMLGTSAAGIKMGEDRDEFRNAMNRINEPCIASGIATSVGEAVMLAEQIGYPVIIRPAFTLGGTGGGIVDNVEDLKDIAEKGIILSRVHQVLVEKCISGWKEIEFEAVRDSVGNAITICSMENVDPVGIHTGDSIVVAPALTLTDIEYQRLRTAALKIVNELRIEGGCNVQFAQHPTTEEYAVIEVNPRLSRSSALASKATGYPIAKVAAKIAIGYTLDEIPNQVTGTTSACSEPAVDYVVTKIPKWPFDKFVKAKRRLGTQMKATGEVMAISNTFESSLMKAVRSLELNIYGLEVKTIKALTEEQLIEKIVKVDDMRIFALAEALRRKIPVEKIYQLTMVDKFFLNRINNIVITEEQLKTGQLNDELMQKAVKQGFPDKYIASLSNITEEKVRNLRKSLHLYHSYKMVDTCAGEYSAVTPYFYSTHDTVNEAVRTDKKKVLVIGSGPIRIGQGIEFDYCSVHSVWALRELGYEAIIANNNPETVSTDFDTSDRLYFEPLTPDDVRAIIENEKPDGVICQFGGQTAIKLIKAVSEMGVKILGTSADMVDAAEDRKRFDAILEESGIKRPKGTTVFTESEALETANSLGYPVLIRPSYVLGGQGMVIAYNDTDVIEYMEIINLQIGRASCRERV